MVHLSALSARGRSAISLPRRADRKRSGARSVTPSPRCADHDLCQAFTYVPPGVQGAQARCWLKSIANPPTAFTGMVSGRILREYP
ncbi:PAN domain-containing protein [Sorangium sp. So ce1504]|uniref:PAN domain-containing protein n=1 Tax=unclassified Sorangium TaxID=2621164 RepID=UPI003F63B679